MITRVYVGVDEVIADTNAVMDKIFDVLDETKYDWADRYCVTMDEIMRIYEDIDFYVDVPVADYANRLLHLLKSHGCDIVFVSSHFNAPLATASKMRWLMQQFIHPMEFVSNKKLLDYNDAFLIDDNDDAGKIQYVWPKPYNQNKNKTYKEALTEIDRILKGTGTHLLARS